MHNDYWDNYLKHWRYYFLSGPDNAHDAWKKNEFLKSEKILRAEQCLPTMCLMQLIAQQD